MSKAVFKRVPTHEVHRTCAVCGRRHGPTYGFARTLAWYGIKGDKATVECIRELGRKAKWRSSSK